MIFIQNNNVSFVKFPPVTDENGAAFGFNSDFQVAIIESFEDINQKETKGQSEDHLEE